MAVGGRETDIRGGRESVEGGEERIVSAEMDDKLEAGRNCICASSYPPNRA